VGGGRWRGTEGAARMCRRRVAYMAYRTCGGRWRDTEARSGGQVAANDGLGQAPAVRGRVRGFHCVCVARCKVGHAALRCATPGRAGPDGLGQTARHGARGAWGTALVGWGGSAVGDAAWGTGHETRPFRLQGRRDSCLAQEEVGGCLRVAVVLLYPKPPVILRGCTRMAAPMSGQRRQLQGRLDGNR
jgi:hypothetical protein